MNVPRGGSDLRGVFPHEFGWRVENILMYLSGGANFVVVNASIQDLRRLPIPERIQLVKELWDSIAEESPAIDLSGEQIAELDRRLDALEAQPESGTPWHIARERILASL